MAENKKSFILYTDQSGVFNQLPDEIAGKLIKHIFAYVNDENPITDDLIINIAFEPIKQSLKRDLKRYEQYVEKQSVNGAKGGRPKKAIETQITQAFFDKPKKADSVSVSVNVNDNVNVNVNNIEERKLKFATTLQPYLLTYGKSFLNDFYKYWTEPNKSNSKFKMELEKTWSLERRFETWAKNEKNFNKKINDTRKPTIDNAIDYLNRGSIPEFIKE
jgi:hypothetical protein